MPKLVKTFCFSESQSEISHGYSTFLIKWLIPSKTLLPVIYIYITSRGEQNGENFVQNPSDSPKPEASGHTAD